MFPLCNFCFLVINAFYGLTFGLPVFDFLPVSGVLLLRLNLKLFSGFDDLLVFLLLIFAMNFSCLLCLFDVMLSP